MGSFHNKTYAEESAADLHRLGVAPSVEYDTQFFKVFSKELYTQKESELIVQKLFDMGLPAKSSKVSVP